MNFFGCILYVFLLCCKIYVLASSVSLCELVMCGETIYEFVFVCFSFSYLAYLIRLRVLGAFIYKNCLFVCTVCFVFFRRNLFPLRMSLVWVIE